MPVSVVIPTYNRAEMLGRALASVFAQTTGDFEVIVVDDGSWDHTCSVVRSFGDPRVIYLRQDTRRGASAARNAGVRACRGEYVAFLDSDDEWLPTKVERQLEVFSRSSAETGLVYTGTVNVHPGRSERTITPRYRGRMIERLLRKNVIGSTSVGMVRRDVLDVVGGFDEELSALQDFDLWVRIACRYRIDVVSEPLVRMHIHGGEERISNDIRHKLAAREVFYAKHRELYRSSHAAHHYHAKTARLYLRLLNDRAKSRQFSRSAIRDSWLSPLGYLSYARTLVPAFVWSGLGAARRTARRLAGEPVST